MPEDPESTLIQKLVPILVKALPYVLGALMGGLGGVSVHEVEDAEHQAKVETNREQLLLFKQQLEEAKAQLASYANTVAHNEEQARERDIRILERRLDLLIFALRAKGYDLQEPMPAPAEAEERGGGDDPAGHRAPPSQRPPP